MKIISWDIGIINLAYCIMEDEKILKWGIIDIRESEVKKKKKSILKIAPILINKVNEDPDLIDIDYVLIENQPCMKNPVMKSIQMILYTFYLMCKEKKCSESCIKDIFLISASNKLKVYDGPVIELNYKTSYTIRKKKAVLHARYFLENNCKDNDCEENRNWLEYFNSNKKKDDLSDTYLQGLYFIKNLKKYKIA